MEQKVKKFYKGMATDTNPSEQKEGFYRYAMNTVIEDSEGNSVNLITEHSNNLLGEIKQGYTIIGDQYVGDNKTVIFSVNDKSGYDEIGLLYENGKYETLVNTKVLGFKRESRIDSVYRVKPGNKICVYWLDGGALARSIDINRLEQYHTLAYKNYLKAGGNPDYYTGEKWDVNLFSLSKGYNKIPYISNAEVLEQGSVKYGSYNFGIQLLDDDLNPTEVISISNTVNIYNYSLEDNYGNIRGNYTENKYQEFDNFNKSIKLTISDLDKNYPFYRVVIIQAKEGTGRPNIALVSPNISTSNNTYIYSGNDDALATINLNEVSYDKSVIYYPQHIEQSDNKLLLANGKTSIYDWCSLQQYASKIKSDLTTKKVQLTSAKSMGNVKNPLTTFFDTGHMPGEVYSYGIIYIMKDFTLSPAFHIPGKNPLDTTSRMGVYTNNVMYNETHNCVTNGYWGKDYMGMPLTGNRVRHHKFPTRKDLGLPLYTKDDNIQYYRHELGVKITLKSGKTYPQTNGESESINYGFRYKLTTANNPTTIEGTLTESLIGSDIILLDEVYPYTIDFSILPSSNEVLEVVQSSDIFVDYADTFDFEVIYRKTLNNTVRSTYMSDMLGIEFSNIECPPDAIGFYIVKNKPTDNDKIVIDNAIMGPNVKAKSFTAFTHFTPGFTPDKLDANSMWFVSPEIQFRQSNLKFNDVQVQGVYETSQIYRPTTLSYVTDKDGKSLNKFPVLGAYVPDVQSGSSYNAEVHKKREKDSDGFGLQVAHKTSYFNLRSTTDTIGKVKDSFTISAGNSKVNSGNTYYNVSTDNRISMITLPTAFDVNKFQTNQEFDLKYYDDGTGMQDWGIKVKASRLFYTTLRRGSYNSNGQFMDYPSAYEDFLVRPYYKTSAEPTYFGVFNSDGSFDKTEVVRDNFKVFAGDAFISNIDLTTTMFRQLKMAVRKNKTGVWNYIIGGLLILGAAVVAIVTSGSGAAVSAAMISAAIGYINSGVQIDKIVNMFNEDYSKGLLDAIEDEVVIGFMGNKDSASSRKLNYGDDIIQWFADRLGSLYIESRVPVGLRAGVNTGETTDFLDSTGYSETIMNNYLIEKLTYFDRERDGGRMYRGIANSEIYSMNPDYLRTNTQKLYIHLPENYNCCNYESNEYYPTRVWYSSNSFLEEKTDNYRIFLPNNYRDLEGDSGSITDLYKIGNSIYVHTEESLWKLPQNIQERVTNELTTYIGTGEFFSIPPQKVVDSGIGTGGTIYKWATQRTKFGTFFISELDGKVYLQSEGLKDITTENERFFREHLVSYINKYTRAIENESYKYLGNTSHPMGTGYVSTYDEVNNRVIFTKIDYEVIREIPVINKALIDVFPNPGVLQKTEVVYNKFYNSFWKKNIYTNGIKYVGEIESFKDYPQVFRDRSFTISYNMKTQSWVSFHSYIPYYYFYNHNYFMSVKGGEKRNLIYKHNTATNEYLNFYGQDYDHVIEFILNENPTANYIYDDISLISQALEYKADYLGYVPNDNITFNKVIFYNDRQSSGEQTIKVKDKGDENFYFNQIVNNLGEITASNNEGIWSINEIRDYVVDYSRPVFSKSWNDIKDEYPTDKVVNKDTIDFNKPWFELQPLRGSYLGVRLSYKPTNNKVKLVTQYIINTINLSFR